VERKGMQMSWRA